MSPDGVTDGPYLAHLVAIEPTSVVLGIFLSKEGLHLPWAPPREAQVRRACHKAMPGK